MFVPVPRYRVVGAVSRYFIPSSAPVALELPGQFECMSGGCDLRICTSDSELQVLIRDDQEDYRFGRDACF